MVEGIKKMIGFEISRNGNVLAITGGDNLIGLNAVLAACGDLSISGGVQVLYMTVLGTAKGTKENTTLHHTWDVAPAGLDTFKVGDSITIRIVEGGKVSVPTSSQELENEKNEPAQPTCIPLAG